MRLRYVDHRGPGLTRRRRGRGFEYIDTAGEKVDGETAERIRSLAVPPAWTDVRICPWPNGHLQATGRDAAGRLQYRYHPEWRAERDREKFERMLDFGVELPGLRARVTGRGNGGRPARSRGRRRRAALRWLSHLGRAVEVTRSSDGAVTPW
ncbi:MAG: hypothetical protein ACM3QU_12200 [Verrucomicrobiota bacterium]